MIGPALIRANWKLIVTAILFAALAVYAAIQYSSAAHWQKMHAGEKAAHAQTVANYREAAKQAEMDDARNIARVKAEQDKITQEITSDYQTRLADARRRAAAMGLPRASEANPRSGEGTGLPAVPEAPSGPDAAPGADRLSLAERLSATETALRLAALQAWVKAQADVDVSGGNDD